MEKEKKRMQQLCRKVCNDKRNAHKASIYKGSVKWFHGKIEHETRRGRERYSWFWRGEKGEKEERKRRIKT